MKKRNGSSKRYVICIDNTDYLVSLEVHKIYEVLPDARAAEYDCIRVIDESGEDYLYSSKGFVPVDLPQKVVVSMNRRLRESTRIAAKAARAATSKNQAQRKSRAQSSPRAGRG